MFQHDFELEAGLDYRPIERTGVEMRPETRGFIENGHKLGESGRSRDEMLEPYIERYEKAKYEVATSALRAEIERENQFLPIPDKEVTQEELEMAAVAREKAYLADLEDVQENQLEKARVSRIVIFNDFQTNFSTS